jgi:hypothetical protein
MAAQPQAFTLKVPEQAIVDLHVVYQYMAHEAPQILAALAPVIEDRPAIEENHVEVRARALMSMARSLSTWRPHGT